MFAIGLICDVSARVKPLNGSVVCEGQAVVKQGRTAVKYFSLGSDWDLINVHKH